MSDGVLDMRLEADRSALVTEVPGVLEVDDLGAGETRVVWVSHNATPLVLWAMPVFSLIEGDVAGLTLTVLDRALAEDATVYATDGTGFLLQVVVAADAEGADKSRGGPGWDWDIYWTRRGIASGEVLA